jgi:hypothetical protein
MLLKCGGAVISANMRMVCLCLAELWWDSQSPGNCMQA